MNDVKIENARESCINALLDALRLILIVSNRTNNTAQLENLRRRRRKINREIDRLELAALNPLLLPDQVQVALENLSALTTRLNEERENITEATATLNQINSALSLANQTISSIASLFLLV